MIFLLRLYTIADTYGEADIVSNITSEATTSVTSLLLSVLANATADPDADDPTNSTSPMVTTTVLPYQTTCINGTSYKLGIEPTDFSAIPTKEIIIVVLMLMLWIYSIMQTRKAWYRLLKE